MFIIDFFVKIGGQDTTSEDTHIEIKNQCLKLVNEFYSQQEQQTLIVAVKSQLIRIERESNKMRHSIEDLTFENSHLNALLDTFNPQNPSKR